MSLVILQRSDEARKKEKSRDRDPARDRDRDRDRGADMEREQEDEKGRSKVVKESEAGAEPPHAKKSKRDHSPVRR